MFEQFEQERVSSFVISGVGFFLLAQSKAAAFLSPADFVARFLELRQSDAFQISARRQQSSLIDDVGQFRSGVTGRATRNDGEIDAFGQLHFLGMDPQNFLATFHIRQVDGDLAIETAGAQQSGIEDVGPVGSGDDNDAFLSIESVHLHEQGIEGLLAFVVATADAVAAMTTDRVNFVDENDTGRGFFALLKHIADAAGADADKHLDEIGTADGKEGDIGLAGNGAG